MNPIATGLNHHGYIAPIEVMIAHPEVHGYFQIGPIGGDAAKGAQGVLAGLNDQRYIGVYQIAIVFIQIDDDFLSDPYAFFSAEGAQLVLAWLNNQGHPGNEKCWIEFGHVPVAEISTYRGRI